MGVDLMPEHIVSLEMKELIEELRFSADGSIHILLRDSVKSNCCGRRRWWFVNRDGETRCWDCDDKALRARDTRFLRRMRVLPI